MPAAVELGVEILAVGASLIAAIVWALKAIVASILKRSEEYLERLILILQEAVADTRRMVSAFESEEKATHAAIMHQLQEAHRRDEMILATVRSLVEVQRDILRILRKDAKEYKS